MPNGRFELASDFNVGRLIASLSPPTRAEFRVRVRRPDDLLVFDLLFENLVLRTDGGPRLERHHANQIAVLVAEFPPQSFGEEAFLESSSADSDDDDKRLHPPTRPLTGATGSAKQLSPYPPKNRHTTDDFVSSQLPYARVRMAGPSRLAFLMPAGQASLSYTLTAVLDAMRSWPLWLDFCAQPDPPETRIARWLTTAVESQAWRATTAHLADALERNGGEGTNAAIVAAGGRLAERAAGGLTGSARHALGKVVFEAMQGEIDQLHAQFPGLQQGPAHQAAIASLAIATAERLAGARAGASVDLVPELPYFPLLFAPHEPTAHITALELPYRLLVSPIEDARWTHQIDPVERRHRTELWHTRLTTGAGEIGPGSPSKVRAIWSPDYPLEQADILKVTDPPKPFRMSLDPLDRQMLVKNMAGYDEVRAGGQPYSPHSSLARRLHLSALGALLDVEGGWSPRPKAVDLEEWRHLASVGRDAYVRVVYAGFLCCLGHAASLVKVTERKFEGSTNQRVALLRQRFFIVVRERVKGYEPGTHVHGGRNFPFTQVEILTRVTPNLHNPAAHDSNLAHFDYAGNNVTPRQVFWPKVETPSGTPADFRFEVIATDIAGKQVTFSVPLLFVSEVVTTDKTHISLVKTAYNGEPPDKRLADLGGATVCFAPHDPSARGDTRLPTQQMTFSAGDLVGHMIDPPSPNFYPETKNASVGIAAVQKLLARPGAVTQVTYPQVYVDHGFSAGQNAGELFLQADGEAHRLEFGNGPGKAKSDALGALVAPAMSILGLSRVMGPVGGKEPPDLTKPAMVASALQGAVENVFDPAAIFNGAKILGGVELASILSKITTGLAGAAVPKLVSRQLADRIEASFDWTTVVDHPDKDQLIMPQADGVRPTTLEMHGRVTTPLGNPAEATYDATAVLTNFKVNLFGFVILWFDRLSFEAHKGRKPDVAVQLHGDQAVRFGGPLEFVNTLRELIPSNGFSDPPALTVTPSGITAGYSLTLPAIPLAIFNLSNLSLGASFVLPFDAQAASVGFNFSERQQPFSLTVSLLGGGGFFAIGISAKGVQEVEAALEFGAAVAINLGVASGSVEIKAGIYFHWLGPASGKGSVELAGYVRLHGELSVLGLISASLTFNLQLAFKKEGSKSTVWGEATLSVEVEVLFFSASVSVSCRREFAGSDADPKFIALMPDQPTWAEYCDAFAQEAV